MRCRIEDEKNHAQERDKRNCKMQQNAQLCTSKVSDLRRRERVDV